MAEPMTAEEIARVFDRHFLDLDAAAIPTKSEVFVLCGGNARELHDAMKGALAMLSDATATLHTATKRAEKAEAEAERLREALAMSTAQLMSAGDKFKENGLPSWYARCHSQADFNRTALSTPSESGSDSRDEEE